MWNTATARNLATIGTHYELLGVPTTATADEIRDAYRARARQHHPDQVGPDRGSAPMAAINEAYRVLRDPASRSQYDTDLRERWSGAQTRTAVRPRTTPPLFTPRPVDTRPARYPWKLVAAMAAIGAGVVLVAAALYDPPEPVQPDNLLRTGSCVALEANNDVCEVQCTGDDDLVVGAIVAFDEACPPGLAAHRDRQGLGMACIARSVPRS